MTGIGAAASVPHLGGGCHEGNLKKSGRASGGQQVPQGGGRVKGEGTDGELAQGDWQGEGRGLD